MNVEFVFFILVQLVTWRLSLYEGSVAHLHLICRRTISHLPAKRQLTPVKSQDQLATSPLEMPMPRIAALYRYPVKGFTPEECESLTVLDDGRVAGDRVLGFRFADSAAPDDEWSNKYECVVLANTPGLARLRIQFDHRTLRLCIDVNGDVLIDETLDDGGRRRIVAAIEKYALALNENPLSGNLSRLPLRMIGDGTTPRYQDDRAGRVTLHGRASVAAVAAAVGDSALDERRFR
ncbi:MAG TPA: hypothetical protein VFM11_11695, partial [Burkholderiales bacterium]|nr:hypothetical protein [Burkholderiales bacterium]